MGSVPVYDERAPYAVDSRFRGNHSMSKTIRTGLRAAVATGLLVVAMAPAVAQADPPAATSGIEPLTTEKPKSLSVTDIPREAETTGSEIRRLVAALRPGELVRSITEQLPELESELSNLAMQIEHQPPEQLSLRRLVRLENDAARLRRRLERWQKSLDDKATAQQAGLDSLREIVDLWRMTREGLSDDEAGGAVMDRVDRLLDRVEQAERETGAHLAQVLVVEERVLGHLGRVRESLVQIGEARERAGSALISPEQPPLWRLFSEAPPRSSVRDAADGLTDLQTELSRFLENNRGRVAVHLLLAAGLFVMIIRLHRGSRKRVEQDPAYERASRVLGRPVAATLLVSLLLMRWLYFQPSRVILEATLLLALAPLMRLLPLLISRRWHKLFFVLGALLVLGRIESLVAERTLTERLLQLLLIGLGLAVLFWLLRSAGPLAGRASNWQMRGAQLAAWSGAGLLSVALIANVAGSVALADLITEAVFFSAYLAVVFLAAFLVLDVLIAVGLERARARSIRCAEVHRETILRRVRWLLQLGFLAWWIYGTLRMLHVDEPVLGALEALLNRTWTVGNFSLSIGSVIAVPLTLWVAVILSRIIHAVLEQDVLVRIALPRGVAGTVAMMARYGVIILGLLAAASAAGMELSQFTIVAGALGVGIGFGMQSLVNNFISGLVLAFERPIHVGDTVETGTMRGRVKKIGIRSSVVRTYEGAEVIVPNGNLISNEVTNWTLSDRNRRLTVAVGVEYGTDPRRVQKILLEAMNLHEKVVRDPQPVALFVGFGDSSLDFEARFWTSHYDDWRVVESEVRINIADGLAQAGVVIPFPQRDLHLRTMEAGKVIVKAQDDTSDPGEDA